MLAPGILFINEIKMRIAVISFSCLLFFTGCRAQALPDPGTVSTPVSLDVLSSPSTNTPEAALPVSTPTEEKMKTYLALGDSYTIGTSVTEDERLPLQLVVALREQGVNIAEPLIIARNGWTTGELAQGIEAAQPQAPFDLVTLLIGVNNQYRGYPLEEYRQEFAALLVQAIVFAGGDPGRVVVLSIPDWGVTPFAEGRDQSKIAAEIDAFNAANLEETQKAGAVYVDITPITRLAADEPTLLASDGLHPSGEMVAQWVVLLLPLVEPLLH